MDEIILLQCTSLCCNIICGKSTSTSSQLCSQVPNLYGGRLSRSGEAQVVTIVMYSVFLFHQSCVDLM